MKLLTKRYDPSPRSLSLTAPKGSKLLCLRMAVTGHCEAVFVCPDESDGQDEFEVLIMAEDRVQCEGGDIADWQHVGEWRYPTGTVVHGFLRKPAKRGPGRPKKQAASPPLDAEA